MIKKTYIPAKPRSSKLIGTSMSGGVAGSVSSSSAGSTDPNSHSHPNKRILDTITQEMLDNALREMLGVESTEEVTDENFFSALRTLKEILDNNEVLKDLFLSKTNNDTAQGFIQFLQGISVEELATLTQGLEIGDYTPGFLGGGGAFKMNNGISELEVDKLTVRMIATFFEIVVSKLRHINGGLVLSRGSMTCSRVVEDTDSYQCFFERGDNNEISNTFVVNDQARCQVFNGGNQKFYWRLVTAVGDDWIKLSKTVGIGDSIPTAGDDIVQLGYQGNNLDHVKRLNAQIIDESGISQYVEIDSFTLEGKRRNFISADGSGSQFTGKVTFKNGGEDYDLSDWAYGVESDIQDAESAANDAERKAQQAIEDAEANVGMMNEEVGRLQAQLDGEVSNWFYPYSPTLSNYPASDWNTNILKDRHIGDTFTNTQPFVDNTTTPSAGKSWRFVKNGSVYSWTLIADSDAVKALLEASKAQATADGKSTTHLIQPTKYELGDMWVLNADQTVNGTAYKQGEILTATQDSATFVQSHWLKRIRYTDDTKANEAKDAADNAQDSANTANQAIGALSDTVGELEVGLINDTTLNLLEEQLRTIKIERDNTINAYNVLDDNPYLTGTAKSTLTTRKGNFVSSVSAIVIALEDAIADGKLTQGELDIIHAALNGYNISYVAFQNAIEQARKAIEIEIDRIAKGYVDNIEIGGRNLLLNSNIFTTGWTIHEGAQVITTPEQVVPEWGATDATKIEIVGGSSVIKIYRRLDNPIAGDTRIISIWVKNDSDSNLNINFHGGTVLSGSSSLSLESGFSGRVIYNVRYNSGYFQLQFRSSLAENSLNFTVWRMQVEKGNKATDWTPAPEDTQAEIDEAKKAGTDASAAVVTMGDSLTTMVNTVTEALEDKVIDEAERKTLIAEQKTLDTEQERLLALVNSLLGSAYLVGNANTALSNASNATLKASTGTLDVYQMTIDVMINAVEITEAMINAYEGAYDNHKSGLSSLNVAIENARKAIDIEVKRLSDENVDAAVIKATYWSIKASTPVIYKDANSATASGTHTPVTVNGELRSGTTTTQGGFISIQPNGGAETTAIASPRTIAPTNTEGKTSYTVRLYEKADKATLLDTMTIPVVFKGASGVNAINASLSNEADVLPASPEGVVSDYTGSGTIIRVFEGATELAYGTGNGQFQVSALGSGISVGTPSTSGKTRVYGVASNMTSDNATITFTISGKTASGASFSLTKVQTFAKSRVGQKGSDGKSITLVDVEYAVNTSTTTPPIKTSNLWQTDADPISGNQQLWTRTKTTYSVGSATYTTPVNITPKTGATGADGNSITSITEWYYLSTSKTELIGGSWSTTPWTWISGMFIWTKTVFTYSKTADTETLPIVSSEWVAIDSIEIGGRNLLLDSERERRTNNAILNIPFDYSRMVGEGLFTISFEARINSGDVGKFDFYFRGNASVGGTSPTKEANQDWERFSHTWELTRTQIETILTVSVRSSHTYASDILIRNIKVEKGNKATDWTPAPEDVQAEIDKAQADANTSLAKTKFMTEIDGGLIYSAMMKLYDAGGTGDEMAGVSGIAGDDKEDPAFWAGGTYEQAIDGTAKAIIRHDGSVKFTEAEVEGIINALGGTIGDLVVEPSGRIAMYMPNTTQSRLTFRATDIPTLTSLLDTTVYGGDFTAGAGSLAIPQTGTSTQTLTGSTVISQTGSTIEIIGGRNLTLTCDFQGTGIASVGATLYLMRYSVKVQALASAFVMGSGIQNDVGVVQSFTLEGMPSGTYTLMLEVNKVGTQLTSGNATVGSGVKVEWSFNREGVRNFLFGLNGFLSFFSNNHIYFTETTGLDVRGKTNMPGLLGSASVISGQLSNEWGRITSIATYTGGYRVTISGMTHDNYTVQITSHTTNQWRIGTKTSSNFIILGTGNCDIAIMGNNY